MVLCMVIYIITYSESYTHILSLFTKAETECSNEKVIHYNTNISGYLYKTVFLQEPSTSTLLCHFYMQSNH